MRSPNVSVQSFADLLSQARKQLRNRSKAAPDTNVEATPAVEAAPAVEQKGPAPEYVVALNEFSKRLRAHQQRAFNAAGTKAVITVEVLPGRKFDRVKLNLKQRGKGVVEEIRYFVDRRDGAIFFAKSPVAPNMKRFYGTIFTSDAWDWSGTFGSPIDAARAGVILAGKYGDAPHYIPLPKNSVAA
jgi:hypothetical protein